MQTSVCFSCDVAQWGTYVARAVRWREQNACLWLLQPFSSRFCYCTVVSSWRLSLAFVSQSFILAEISFPLVLFGPNQSDLKRSESAGCGITQQGHVGKTFLLNFCSPPRCNSCYNKSKRQSSSNDVPKERREVQCRSSYDAHVCIPTCWNFAKSDEWCPQAVIFATNNRCLKGFSTPPVFVNPKLPVLSTPSRSLEVYA